MSQKACKGCMNSLSIDAFGPNQSKCRECRARLARIDRQDNPARQREASRRWRESHAESVSASNARRYRENKVRDFDRHAASNARHREANRAKAALDSAAWRLRNPERSIAHRIARVQRLKSVDSVPFTGVQLRARMAYFGNRCWMCHGNFECIDHVKPVAKRGPHMLANLRPACTNCNRRKHATWAGIATVVELSA